MLSGCQLTEQTPDFSIQSSTDSDKSEPVTAARRHGNLKTIRKQSGWGQFPECIPLSMRTTKSGKVTKFGNTKLRIIERIAVNANFTTALAYLESIVEDGTRLLSLKDLERCAAHFDTLKPASRRGSSAVVPSIEVNRADEDHSPHQSSLQPLYSWDQFNLDQMTIPVQPGPSGPSSPALKRPSPESFESLSQSPILSHSKRLRVDTLSDIHSGTLWYDLPSAGSSNSNEFDTSLFAAQHDSSMRNFNYAAAAATSPSQNPARALLSLHPNAGSIFTNLNDALENLLSRVEDQQELVKSALDQLRMTGNGLDAATNAVSSQVLEGKIMAAQRHEVRARHVLHQARSARDVMDLQYSHIGTSLSRTLLGTVRDEHTRAEAAMIRAQADVESARQRLGDANNRVQTLRRAKEVAEVGIDQLQRQTRCWLRQLTDARGKLTDQLSALQGRDVRQASTQM